MACENVQRASQLAVLPKNARQDVRPCDSSCRPATGFHALAALGSAQISPKGRFINGIQRSWL